VARGAIDDEQAPAEWKYAVPVALLAALGIALTIGLVLQQRHYLRESTDAVVGEAVATTAERATQSLGTLNGSLGSVAGWFSVHEYVAEAEFQQFVEATMSDRTDLQAVQYAPLVRADQRPKVERQLAARGHRGLITEPSAQGLQEAGPGRDYLPVIFSSPKSGNEMVYGLDALARPQTQSVIRRARDTGMTQTGPLIQIVQSDEPALLLYTPVYESRKVPTTTPARRAAWRGIVVAVLRVDDWMAAATTAMSSDDVDLALLDSRQDPAQTVWTNGSGADERQLATWTGLSRIVVGDGQQFELAGRPNAALMSTQESWRPWTALTAGLLLTLLLCASVWKWLDARRIRNTAADLQQATNRLRFLAERDPLTGLPHRDGLRSWLDEWAARNPDRSLALLFVDLDGFKEVNTTWGHPTGDLVLRQIGQRLAVLGGDSDSTAARLGGDEFVVTWAMDRGSLEGLTTMVQTLINEPIPIGDRDVQMTSSVGIAVRPEDGATLDALLINADIAVRAAKTRPPNSVVRFDPVMAAESAAHRQMARALRVALRRPDDSFFLEYQPQIDMRTGSLVAAEALVRWRDASGRLVSPLEFIPQARDHGLLVRLGAWILDRACTTLAEWQQEGPAVVAVNVDTVQLTDDFAAIVSSAMERRGVTPERLVIEVTEGAAMNQDAQRELDRIRLLGLNIAIDDFGTGFSSLSRLTDLPTHQLKIDRAFIAGLGESTASLEIVRTIVALGRALNLEVLAEGVETPLQAQVLLAEGVHIAQGFLFSRPISAAQCLQLWQAGIEMPQVLAPS